MKQKLSGIGMPTTEKTQSLTGRVVFQYFYDCGGDIELAKIPRDKLTLIERPKAKGARVLAPKYEEVGLQPLEANLGTVKIDGYEAAVEGRIFPIGAIGIYLSVEFRKDALDDVVKLVGLDEQPVKVGSKETEFEEVPREFFDKLMKTVKPAIV